MKKSSILCGILLLMFVLTACSGNTLASTPTVDPSVVAAVVATMLAANTTATPLPQPTATLTLEPPTVLPRSLYYLAPDANGKTQIYRLSRDGVTITQVTLEPDGIGIFDISPVDGTIAYFAQNSLITVNANGENRQILMQDPNIAYSPIWSPDGTKIAYGAGKDIDLYSLVTGNNEILLTGDEMNTDWPEFFSPDGQKLIVRTRGSGPEAGARIYDLASQTLISIGDGKPYCFAGITWNTRDDFFCYKHDFAGGGWLGLSRVNANNGSVQRLVFSNSCPPCLPVTAPRQSADGSLYYLYAEVHDMNQTSPALSLVHSAPDGVSDRAMLRTETFNVLNALWTPNGKALLIVQGDGDGIHSSPISLVLAPVDPSLPVITLIVDASKIGNLLRWGP